jgi:hypothetical protein
VQFFCGYCNSRIKICFTTRGGFLCSKANLYSWFTCFRGILSLIQVYIFGIYVKFCVFWYPYCEKIIFDPYVLHGPKSVHLCGSSQWTKHDFKHILQTFVTKWTFPSLTVVLIPISTHRSIQSLNARYSTLFKPYEKHSCWKFSPHMRPINFWCFLAPDDVWYTHFPTIIISYALVYNVGCGSGSGLDTDSMNLWIRIPNLEHGSRSSGNKIKKKYPF